MDGVGNGLGGAGGGGQVAVGGDGNEITPVVAAP